MIKTTCFVYHTIIIEVQDQTLAGHVGFSLIYFGGSASDQGETCATLCSVSKRYVVNLFNEKTRLTQIYNIPCVFERSFATFL